MYETGLMHGRDGVQTIATHSSSFMHDTKWTCREIDLEASHPLRISESFPDLQSGGDQSHERLECRALLRARRMERVRNYRQ